MTGADQPRLVRNADDQQYELWLDDQRVGLATYQDRGGAIVLPHTETLPAYGGRGLASILVGFALDDIRAQGRTVVASCPFVADFIAKHPEYQDLLR